MFAVMCTPAPLRRARETGDQKWLRDPASLKASVDKWSPAAISFSVPPTVAPGRADAMVAVAHESPAVAPARSGLQMKECPRVLEGKIAVVFPYGYGNAVMRVRLPPCGAITGLAVEMLAVDLRYFVRWRSARSACRSYSSAILSMLCRAFSGGFRTQRCNERRCFPHKVKMM